jgi:hypothetical protein
VYITELYTGRQQIKYYQIGRSFVESEVQNVKVNTFPLIHRVIYFILDKHDRNIRSSFPQICYATFKDPLSDGAIIDSILNIPASFVAESIHIIICKESQAEVVKFAPLLGRMPVLQSSVVNVIFR